MYNIVGEREKGFEFVKRKRHLVVEDQVFPSRPCEVQHRDCLLLLVGFLLPWGSLGASSSEGPSKPYAERGVEAYAPKMLGIPKSEKEEIECLFASIVPSASEVL
ncbi:unnamed protein product [Sphenostylis stenocarpa]|uniref:Uncharacterized protein n=1 Tax=Sphenostylis stenocarpa TaxID=92480 RepID=A0AA86V2D6_9FABA|nr:unnamed protein product [Sphenostylis stenocarpa]